MGAGLPAMQAPRCISDTEVMLSQASQLPHKPAFHIDSGAAYETRLALTSLACSSAWYEDRTNGPEATFLKPIL
ncbi:hypothetical protein C1X27_09640 [Pseudomonas sp. MPR-AND1B]|nr:hypothetical protein C1X26_12180 [Pseudomonas sp. MPR-R3A]PMY98104.1 hypothetical protein C1X24_11460 [Pseudomonas sp. FW305-124]PMZ73294.1 hypothetical protein C1X25_09185 [Pseudomonas sp. GW247-3R2A]PNA92692.1 hypothetical protein C1X23_13970 [Pseudomonas sp. FW300-E2]PNB03244.1 hypothetical protein C1X27_09640 [Pseudomonas sp. MPR-AND1B]PRW67933.1 hypothetical protein C7A09_15270 [Pseudomonas fluorescens]